MKPSNHGRASGSRDELVSGLKSHEVMSSRGHAVVKRSWRRIIHHRSPILLQYSWQRFIETTVSVSDIETGVGRGRGKGKGKVKVKTLC